LAIAEASRERMKTEEESSDKEISNRIMKRGRKEGWCLCTKLK